MNSPYFIVHAVQLVDDVAFVDGRLGEGTMKVGHVFRRSYSELDSWRSREDGQPCDLVLHEIEAYQHKLDELSAGMTARLFISGSHLALVTPLSILE